MKLALKLLASTAFASFDLDNSGRISTSELKQTLGRMGIKLRDSEASELMAKYDTDGNAELDQEEV